jgi:putative flippase GtrA
MQLVMFALVGVASTLAYGLLYLWFRGSVTAQAANLLALLVTAVGNTAANRRFTFGVTGPRHAVRHQLQGLAIFLAGLGVTSGALWLLESGGGRGQHGIEVAVLTGANLFVTMMRFVLLRAWVFVRHPSVEPVATT